MQRLVFLTFYDCGPCKKKPSTTLTSKKRSYYVFLAEMHTTFGRQFEKQKEKAFLFCYFGGESQIFRKKERPTPSFLLSFLYLFFLSFFLSFFLFLSFTPLFLCCFLPWKKYIIYKNTSGMPYVIQLETTCFVIDTVKF